MLQHNAILNYSSDEVIHYYGNGNREYNRIIETLLLNQQYYHARR
jgi:hypothetical protein